MIDRLPQTPIDTPGNAALGAYAHPQDVVGDANLTPVEKRRILNEWADSAKARKQASPSGVSPASADGDIAEIERALAAL